MIRKSVSFSLFLLAAVIALLVVFLGLRLYYNQARLDKQLTYQLSGNQFIPIEGQTRILSNGILDVSNQLSPDSKILLEKLNIQADIYDTLTIQFADKLSQQSLLLSITTQHPQTTVKQSILYTNQEKASQFLISDLVPREARITSIALSTPKLIDSYRLRAIILKPKQINILRFLYFLGSDISQVFHSEQTQEHFVLPAYYLILLYIACLFVTYFLLLSWVRQPKAIAWWMTVAVAWVALDIAYLWKMFVHALTSTSDFSEILASLLSLSPWVLGTIISLLCVKRRYGYFVLALGYGYLIAAVLTAAIIMLAKFYQWSLNWPIIWFVECLLAAVLLYFLRPKKCSIEEFRLEKAPANRDYLITFFLILLTIIHVLFITHHLTTEFSSVDLITERGIPDNRIQQLLQAYWQATAETSLELAAIWCSLLLATAFIVFGGLRYLGVALLPAMLACYALLSLPLWKSDLFLSLGYGNALGMLAYLALLLLIALLFSYREYRLLVLLIPVALIFIVNAEYYLLLVQGKLMVFGTASDTLDFSLQLPNVLSILLSRSYLLLPTVLGSLFLWLFVRHRDNDASSISVLLILAVVTLALFVWGSSLMLNNGEVVDLLWIDYTLFPLAAIACLIPACVYQLVTRDEETLPTL